MATIAGIASRASSPSGDVKIMRLEHARRAERARHLTNGGPGDH